MLLTDGCKADGCKEVGGEMLLTGGCKAQGRW